MAARSIRKVPKACRMRVDRASCRNWAGRLSLSHLVDVSECSSAEYLGITYRSYMIGVTSRKAERRKEMIKRKMVNPDPPAKQVSCVSFLQMDG